MPGYCKSEFDISGQVFGSLTVISPSEKRSGRFILWECQCACGNTIYARRGILSGNNGKAHVGKKSCGCLFRRIGKKYNSLTVVDVVDKTKYKCLCDCGKSIIIENDALYQTKSCGCTGRRKRINISSESQLIGIAHAVGLTKSEIDVLRVIDLQNKPIKEAAEILGKPWWWVARKRRGVYNKKLKDYLV